MEDIPNNAVPEVHEAALSHVSPEDSHPAHRHAAKALPADLSPRSRLFSAGAAVLSPIELLSLCLGGGRAEADSLALAAEVLTDCGGLHGLLRSSVYDLVEVRGVGEAKAAALLAAVELARRMPEATGPVRTAISSPADVAGLLQCRVAHEDREHFVVVLLNTKNRVIGAPTVSIGTLSASIVHPREVFKPAIKAGAASVILAHNHPSGNVEPSREDKTVTNRLVETGETIGIEVLDHVILGGLSSYSFKERGLL